VFGALIRTQRLWSCLDF